MRSFGAEKKVSQNYDRDIDKSFKVGVKVCYQTFFFNQASIKK